MGALIFGAAFASQVSFFFFWPQLNFQMSCMEINPFSYTRFYHSGKVYQCHFVYHISSVRYAFNRYIFASWNH